MIRRSLILLCIVTLIAGCSSSRKGGGYYKDDGPGSHVPANIEAIPNAVPRIETHAPANMRPYVVFGKRYVPISDERAFRQTGAASWYGRKFHGKKTANGETYDMYAMTAAHPTLPLPSYARVTRTKTGKSIIVRINDRGPFHSSRIIDLSYVAAAKLGLIGPGSGQVIVEAITNADIRNNSNYRQQDAPAPKAVPIPDASPPVTPALITRADPSSQISTPTPDALAVLNSPALSGSGAAQHTPAPIPGMHAATYTPATASHSTSAPVQQVFLQYGAFSTHENASQLAHTLNQEIGPVEPRRAQVSSTANLHRVQIGPYASRAQAVNAALRIQAATGRTAAYSTQDADSPEHANTAL